LTLSGFCSSGRQVLLTLAALLFVSKHTTQLYSVNEENALAKDLFLAGLPHPALTPIFGIDRTAE
jgi:hypothetical protein